MAYADHFYFHPDPVIHYVVPADGDYILEIHDSIYRGREDFVYRLSVGELPYLTGIFPLGGRVSARANVALQGWNLPAATAAESSKSQGIASISVPTGNRRPFAFDILPEALAKDSIGTKQKAQKLKLPVIVNGRIALQPGEWDFFRFEGKAGDEIVAEVVARRLDSPLDSILILTNAAGTQLAANRRFSKTKARASLPTRPSRASSFNCPPKPPTTSNSATRSSRVGPNTAYRLRLSHPEPDFDLRVVPSSLNVRGGATHCSC